MNTRFSDKIDYEFWHQLNRTYKSLNNVRRKEFRKLGVSKIESAVIVIVGSYRSLITPAEISRRMIEQPHSISQLLKQMENRGLITRIKDLSRKNTICVELTKRGKEIYTVNHKSNPLDSIISVLPDSKKALVISLLKKIEARAIAD
jgi:DNA-binding MarR family transcriptional regulator